MSTRKTAGYLEVGYAEDRDGRILAREFDIFLKGRWHRLNVATPDHIEYIHVENARGPEEGGLFDNYLPMADLSSVDHVCKIVRELPWNELEPYLDTP
jgi:hypothetical protein